MVNPLLSNGLSFSQVITANHIKLQMSEGYLTVRRKREEEEEGCGSGWQDAEGK